MPETYVNKYNYNNVSYLLIHKLVFPAPFVKAVPRLYEIMQKRCMAAVGFEPTPPKRLVP